MFGWKWRKGREAILRKIKRPSQESEDAEWLRRKNAQAGRPDDYVSDSFTDSSARGGPLGIENEMPEGGNSTRGLSAGPASKSPLPTKRTA